MNLDLVSKIFNNSKYFKWYLLIINSAKLRNIDRKPGFHRHHILPRCLGGNDKKANLVSLTFREHFIVHKLLCKSVILIEHKYKMLKALKFMMMNGQILLGTAKNSKSYERNTQMINSQFSEAMSLFMIELHKNYPEKFLRNIESRLKTSKKMFGENNGMYDKKHSEISKIGMSEKRLGRFLIYKDGIRKFIRKDELANYFESGWIPNPKEIYQGKVDEKYLNVEKFKIEVEKFKSMDKIPKSRALRPKNY